jgi:hypothetical protein
MVVVINAVFTASNSNAHAAALYDELRASASYACVPLGVSLIPPLEQQPQGDAVMMSSTPPVLLRVSGGRWPPGCPAGMPSWWTASQSQCATHVFFLSTPHL